jgi:hypothetical protein
MTQSNEIAIVTAYDKGIAHYADLCSFTKSEYCGRYGYKFFLDIKDEIPSGFIRISYILELMSLYPDIKWFVWMDNDTMIMNYNISLQSIIGDGFDFIIGEDWNGINSGVFFIRNCDNSKRFLQSVLDHKHTEEQLKYPKWWTDSEQAAIAFNLDKINALVCHHSIFNGYIIGPRPDNDWRTCGLGPFNKDYQAVQFKFGDFILHFVGDYQDNKIRNINKYLDLVIK